VSEDKTVSGGIEKGTEALRCAGIARFVDTYLDGEFGERERAEFEAHLADCERCRAKVREQAEWKRAIKAAAPREQAPAALRNRIQRSISREGRPGAESRRAGAASWRRFAIRYLPIAAAAGLVATVASSSLFRQSGSAGIAWSPVAADVIAKHRRNLPIEVQGGPQDLRRWYSDKVDFPVKPPQLPAAALRGGRLANVGDRQAAYLVYDKNGNKVSVFIFDPGEMRIEAQRKAVVGNREVYLDQDRGYNVALFRDNGVGYAIASELDPDEMLKLVGGFAP
jgi:mycothiol system anti-sigma-R factor